MIVGVKSAVQYASASQNDLVQQFHPPEDGKRTHTFSKSSPIRSCSCLCLSRSIGKKFAETKVETTVSALQFPKVIDIGGEISFSIFVYKGQC